MAGYKDKKCRLLIFVLLAIYIVNNPHIEIRPNAVSTEINSDADLRSLKIVKFAETLACKGF